jgi:long-chain fatty acid transport protein
MRKFVIASITVLAPAAAHAGGYALPDANARTLALSQSDLADPDGASSLLRNPAALPGHLGLDFSGSFEWLANRTDWSDPDLGDASLKFHFNSPIAAALSFSDALSNGMKWGVGVGVNTPYGGSINWPKGWAGQEYVQSVDQKVFAITAGGGFQPVSWLSIGAAYIRYQGSEELHQSVNYVDHYGDAGIALSGGDNTFLLSMQAYVPKIPLELAVSYKHKAVADIGGDAHFENVPPAFTTLLHDQPVTSNIKLPSELHVGAAYAVRPDLNVMFTFTEEFWSIYHDDTFVGSSGFTVTVPRNYQNAQVYRLGGEWVHVPFMQALTLRLGGLRSVSPQPSDTISPSLTDGDSWAFSAGAGVDIGRNLRVDLGYQHAIFDKVTSTGADTLSGSYSTNVDELSIGINVRLDVLGRSSR